MRLVANLRMERPRERSEGERKRARGTQNTERKKKEEGRGKRKEKKEAKWETHARWSVCTRKTYARACPPPPLCTTRDRELAPPRARVGQSLLLTHTRRERRRRRWRRVRSRHVHARNTHAVRLRERTRERAVLARGSVKGASDDFRAFDVGTN